jgi:hypothetical protein
MRVLRYFIAPLIACVIGLLLPTVSTADQYLRQSTASQEVYFGPFVDDTDFKTAETALSIANTDIKCLKAGATAEVSKNSGGATHIANGRYYAVMDATDTDTLGSMRCSVKMSGALEVWENFHVMSPTGYDPTYGALVGAYPALGISDSGTAQAATSTTIQLRSAAVFADSTPIGSTVFAFGSTQGYWQQRTISSYVGSTDTATVTAWTVTPSGTITYVVFATPPNNFDAASAAIQNMASAYELDGSVYRLTTNALEQAPQVTLKVRSGSATATGSTTTFVDSAAPEALDGALNDYWVRWTSGSNSGKTSRITAFNSSTKGHSLAEALPNAVASGNTYDLYSDAPPRLAGMTHTGAVIPLVSSLSGHTPQTGDAFARLGTPAGSTIAADIAAVPPAVWAITLNEPAGPPNWNASAREWLAWFSAWTRNEIRQTSTTKTLRNDANSAPIANCTVSDDGTTFTVAECAAP